MDSRAQRLAVIALVTLAGAVWLHVRGPVPIIRYTTQLDQPMSNWYTISAFPILGMLCADLLASFQTLRLRAPTLELGGAIGVLLALSGLRLGTWLPVSGHVALLSYFLARRLVTASPSNSLRHLEFVIAVAILAVIAYGKLAWWDDPWTLYLGAGFGVALAVFLRALSTRLRAAADPF